MKKKFRLDFSAHTSVVVAVDDCDEELMEEEAIRVAQEYLLRGGIETTWELDDGGFDDVDDSEEAVNDENYDYMMNGGEV